MCEWCRGVVVKRVWTHNTGHEFESYTCHDKNAINEEGNGKPPHKFHFPRKNSEPRLWFLLRSTSSMLNNIDDEGNGKPPNKIPPLERTQSPVSDLCYASNVSVQEALQMPNHSEFMAPSSNCRLLFFSNSHVYLSH